MTDNEWICPKCGAACTGKFCGVCGCARPADATDGAEAAKDEEKPLTGHSEDTPENHKADAPAGENQHDGAMDDQTMVMPAVNPSLYENGNAGAEPPYQQPYAGPQYQQPYPGMQPQGSWLSRNRKPALIGGAVLLVIIAIGIVMYLSNAEKNYLDKCESARAVLEANADTLGHIDSLNGDPDSDDAKKLIDKLDSAEKDAGSAKSKVSQLYIPKRYSAQNAQLKASIELQKAIIADAKKVVKDPTGDGAADAVKRVRSNVKDLKESIGACNAGSTDYTKAFTLDKLPGILDSYINKKKTLDAKKAAEEAAEKARKAAEEKRARMAEYNRRRDERNQSQRNRHTLVWLTDSVEIQGKDICIHGKFYNGTSDELISDVTKMSVTITLWNGDQQVFTRQSNFSDFTLSPAISPGGTDTWTLRMTGKAGSLTNQSFDHFDVVPGDIYWKYYNY